MRMPGALRKVACRKITTGYLYVYAHALHNYLEIAAAISAIIISEPNIGDSPCSA